MHQVNTDLLLSQMELGPFDRPRRLQPEQTAPEICVLHTIHRHAGTAPTPSAYPPRTRKNRIRMGGPAAARRSIPQKSRTKPLADDSGRRARRRTDNQGQSLGARA